MAWPSCSSDLYLLDFFLGGDTGNIDYESPVEGVEDLLGPTAVAIDRIRRLQESLKSCAIHSFVGVNCAKVDLYAILSIYFKSYSTVNK